MNLHIGEIVKSQREFYRSNKSLSLEFRLTNLKKLKSLIVSNMNLFHKAIYDDFAKSSYENELTEIIPIIEEIDIAIKKLRKWVRPKRVGTNILNFPAKSYIVPEPLGVCLIIGAWNFPYNLSLTPLVGAIAAGNTAILKPSELSKQTSALMTMLINENFDSNYLHVIEGGVDETTELLKHKFDKIFFTGSPQVGKIINMAAAKNLTNITLELGGKNPVIVHKDASLKISVKRMLWAKFTNSGQLCIAPDYILVHKEVKDKFLDCVVEELKKAKYSFKNNNYVKIINDRNFQRLVNLIDENKVFYGGKTNKTQRYIEPTILNNIDIDDAIMQEEIFGPLLPVLAYENIDEAFALIKNIEKPLAAYLYSNNKGIKKRFLSEIPFGSGGINDSVMQISNPNLPFGGVGNSGIGSYHGRYSFNCFSHFKSVLDKPVYFESNLKYYGYNKKKISLIKKLF
ncbi:MAG: aldehyde dehydrogenase family protein [Marinifilaceae bacterium]|jgi:aldehyde dehydrogenase (NAD+)|nr:aldehyde dehydrogenase family protein [Marinifilaceae bacterium]